MRNPPVHWSEGMFLRPQHLQAADRYWTEFIGTSIIDLLPYAYGVRKIDISEQAIANFQIEVNRCEARLRDGTLISIGAGEEIDRVDLRQQLKGTQNLQDLFLEHDSILVYLAVPRLKLGHANTARGESAGHHRYLEFSNESEEENAGGSAQEVSYRELNFKILLSTDDLSGHEVLPLFRIVRNESDGSPKVDEKYFPPCLSVDAWEPLGIGMVRRIYDMLGERIERYRGEVLNQNVSWDPREVGDIEKMMRLSTLNGAYAELRTLGFADGIHPLHVYTALCRIIGQLAIFDDELRCIEEIPKYDHDNLGEIFRWAYTEISRLSEGKKTTSFEQRYFLGAGKGMQVSLDPKWFDPSWEWYIGFEGINVSKDETYRLITSGFNWVFGSADQVETLFSSKIQGVRLRPVTTPPRVFPTGGNWVYFQAQREGPAWERVQMTQTMGWRFQEEYIHDIQELREKRRLVLSINNQLIAMHVAVFALNTNP
ncbi:MAG: type VI secretion system baseplate subunit TssK [Blastopirellula sp.]|nr:MAG: type VI secretion system baseplate subunit TssK [Blastopirellula sp.]